MDKLEPKTRILAVDDDPDTLELIRLALEAHGFEVITVDDPLRGVTEALRWRPALIISDIHMPGLDGWSFVRLLRARPDTALLPFIFLTTISSDSARLKSFRLGADEFLGKPFRLSDLLVRVSACLARHARLSAARDTLPQEPAALSGSIHFVGLSALLSMLETERKSGILSLSCPPEYVAVSFLDGSVVDVHTDRPRPPIPALMTALRWSSGTFEFRPVEVTPGKVINMSATHLLLEMARLLDEHPAS